MKHDGVYRPLSNTPLTTALLLAQQQALCMQNYLANAYGYGMTNAWVTTPPQDKLVKAKLYLKAIAHRHPEWTVKKLLPPVQIDMTKVIQEIRIQMTEAEGLDNQDA